MCYHRSRTGVEAATMSDLDDLRLDHHRESHTASAIANTSYYSNPVNPLDIATPGGRELLDKIHPSSSNDGRHVRQSPLLILCIAVAVLAVLLS